MGALNMASSDEEHPDEKVEQPSEGNEPQGGQDEEPKGTPEESTTAEPEEDKSTETEPAESPKVEDEQPSEPEEPPAEPEEPPAKSEEPPAKSEEPPAKSEEPPAKPEEPPAKPEETVKDEEPAVEDSSDEKAKTEEEAPVVEKEKPVEEPSTPKPASPPPKKEKAPSKPAKETPPKAPKIPPGKKGQKDDPGEEIDEDFKYIVRIANTDLDGYKTVEWGLTAISGIGLRLAVILATSTGIPRDKKLGKLTDEEVEHLEEQVKNIQGLMPSWLLNRQKDLTTGDDVHIFGPEIQLTLRDDINRLKMIRCYRGIRHEQGQKVRGQRTRANGRSGVTVGVVKKAIRQKQTGAGDKKKK
jgi:small subunit ribosomal protein S13